MDGSEGWERANEREAMRGEERERIWKEERSGGIEGWGEGGGGMMEVAGGSEGLEEIKKSGGGWVEEEGAGKQYESEGARAIPC